jgi:hypothetical protein
MSTITVYNANDLCRDCHDWYDGKAHDRDGEKSAAWMQHLLSKEAGEQHWYSLAPSAAARVTCVETPPAATTASHDGEGRSSREHPHGNDHPFPMQEATEQVAYPLHPPVFVAQ